eukprot:TRINITY_DN4839_c0_g1_i1.p1 TRINITY_DN4839_c0_g1~~TRINITY_DN4839_c0_g1_i1.p1  ORF type:complete len:1135 (-),score=304.00 TRINITY_DN4839_c0_g1_i1:39-2981(-)
MERLRDLLNPDATEIRIRENKQKTVYLEGVTEVYVASQQDVVDVMDAGQVNRKTAATKMNAESSRSHSIFCMTLTSKNLEQGGKTSGKLYLVDLAGSEKVGKTGASGQTLQEAQGINKSLSALGNVINALTSSKKKHIPYRDSKLTRLLQQSLGGNSRTTLCINCSPSSVNEDETISTLRFGTRAKSIKNQAKVNKELSVEQLTKMLAFERKEVARLKLYCAGLEDELQYLRGDAPTEIPPETRAAMAAARSPGASAAPASGPSILSPNTRSKLPNVAQIEDRCVQLEGKLADAKKETEEMLNKQDELVDQIAEASQELETREGQIEELKAALEEAKATQVQFEKENNILQADISELRLAKEKLEFENEEIQLNVESLTEQKGIIEEERDQLQKTVDELEVRTKKLEEEDARSKKRQGRMLKMEAANSIYLDSSEKLRKSLEADMSSLDVIGHELDANSEQSTKQETVDTPNKPVVAAQTAITNSDPNLMTELETMRSQLEALKKEKEELAQRNAMLQASTSSPAPDHSQPKSFLEELEEADSASSTPTIAITKETAHKPAPAKKLDNLGFPIEGDGESLAGIDTGGESLAGLENMDPLPDNAALLISNLDDVNVKLGDELTNEEASALRGELRDTEEHNSQSTEVSAEAGGSGMESVEMEMLRADMEEKDIEVETLQKENEKLRESLKQLRTESEAKFTEFAKKKEAELAVHNEEKRLKLEKELNELRGKTSTKWQEFDQLKTSLLHDLQDRCEKVIDLEMLLDEAREQYEQLLKTSSGKSLQKKNIFLERSLDALRRKDQKLVNANNALRLEKKVSEKKLAARNERIRGLEVLLTNAQEKLQQKTATQAEEIAKYKSLVESLQSKLEQAKTSGTRSRSNSFNSGGRIAKPIRGGRKLTASGNLGGSEEIANIVAQARGQQKKKRKSSTPAKSSNGRRSKRNTPTATPPKPTNTNSNEKKGWFSGILRSKANAESPYKG